MKHNTEIITKDKIKSSKWSGGITNEIYIYPQGASYKERNFMWRISSATVELEHSTFTYLKGVHRYITTLKGEMSLSHDKGPLIKLKPYEVHQFEGDVNTESFGKVTDFNLMLANGTKGILESMPMIPNYNYDMPIDILKTHEGKVKNCSLVFYTDKGDLTISIDDEKILLNSEETCIVNFQMGREKPCINISSKILQEILISVIYV